MPIQSCSSGGNPGYKSGESGKCYTYTPGDSASRVSAKNKAMAQERAVYASGGMDKMDGIKVLLQNFTILEMESYEEFLEKMSMPLQPAEHLIAETLHYIVSERGKLEDGDGSGLWVGYKTPEENEDKDIGVKCANCHHFVSDSVCMIVKRSIMPEGICRLAAIPSGLVQINSSDEKEHKEEEDDRYSLSTNYVEKTLQKNPSSTPAPPKDRRTGSSKNPSGSAESGASVTFSEAIITSLNNKIKEHNEKNSEASKRATLSALKAVYRRGAGAFSTSHRPGMARGQWAMARVNAYLYLLRNGRPSNPKYITDNDLLPKGHPKSSK
jgi:hypothetical protein